MTTWRNRLIIPYTTETTTPSKQKKRERLLELSGWMEQAKWNGNDVWARENTRKNKWKTFFFLLCFSSIHFVYRFSIRRCRSYRSSSSSWHFCELCWDEGKMLKRVKENFEINKISSTRFDILELLPTKWWIGSRKRSKKVISCVPEMFQSSSQKRQKQTLQCSQNDKINERRLFNYICVCSIT